MERVYVGIDRGSLPVWVTGNLDNLVYFAASAVVLWRRLSPLAEAGVGIPLKLSEVSRGYRSKRLLVG